MKKVLTVLMILMLQTVPALAVSSEESGAPEALAAWEPWVLYGHEDQYLCQTYEGGPGRLCAWPIRLSLDLHQDGGSFSAIFELNKEGRFPLPGGPGAWPVMVGDQNSRVIPVLGRSNPEIWLPAGRHQINGFFKWDRLPDTIQTPVGFILELRVNGRSIDFPPLETDFASGQTRLWLKEKEKSPAEAEEAGLADRLTVTVSRLLQDSQPMMIKSRFKLRVSGQAREVLLDNALLPGTQATFLSSPLPARLSPEGLRVMVKPGIYELQLDSRSLNRSESLGPVAVGSAGPEYWAFQAQNHLRLAEISGAEQIDASQADILPDWRSLPIYLLLPGSSLEFKTIRRGDPEPPPDLLQLNRECWLDYNGDGLSCRDQLSGELSRQWHLNASEPFTLASASLDGQPQVITWQINSRGQKAPGLQLRKGQVDLLADLRIDDFNRRLPASGWDHQLDTEGQKLNLPPGYRLFHASGADVKQAGSYSGAGTWTGAWSTLDFFLVLIISIAVWKIYGRLWGLLALVALIFCYHEPGAPRLVFLHLLACAALLRLLPPTGKARWLLRTWQLLASLTLLVLSALFLIEQARLTLYPQLENPGQGYSGPTWNYADLGRGRNDTAYDMDYSVYPEEAELSMAEPSMALPAPTASAAIQTSMSERRLTRGGNAGSSAAQPAQSSFQNFSNKMVHLTQAPDAKVQNSAPRPAWNWRSVRLYYNASVTSDQEVELYLLGPTVGRFLGLMRIALMTALTLLMLGAAGSLKDLNLSGSQAKSRPLAQAATTAALVMLFLMAVPAAALSQDFPDRDLLNDFRSRLLEKKNLPPPSVPELRISTQPERLLLEFTVEAAEETVLALPTLDREIFRPERVSLDGRDLPLIEENGRWLVLLPAGRNQMRLAGRLKTPGPNFQAFQISFPDSARPQRTSVIDSPAWKIEGLERDGQMIGKALSLSAQGLDQGTGEAENEGGTSVTLTPFFLVERTLSLGLDWKVHSTVRRVTPAGTPVSLRLPLLPYENPLSGDLRPDDDWVNLNFGPQVTQLSWESSLPFSPEIALQAESGPWTESWSLDVSPIWRVQHQGLPPIHNLSDGFWQPQWRPWPGESLTLSIDRPQAVPGQYLVIDHSELSLNAGDNKSLARLQFRVRASQGGPYSFSLPLGVAVREFKVNGRSVPLAPGGGSAEKQPASMLTASLTPGEHEIEVGWDQEEKLGLVSATPRLDLEAPTANLTVSLTLPEDRWILWAWGPIQGPAVQFWPLLAVLLLAALFLGRRGSTPLNWGSWFLLGVGLIQLNIFGALAVAGWLLALGRRQNSPPAGVRTFNAGQIILTIWTVIALFLIYKGIEYGLLQNPDMLISGGGSYGQRLSWFSDRVTGPWPQGRVLSVSLWFYKALMLAWSLWLAVSVVRWLKWGWRAFSSEALWK